MRLSRLVVVFAIAVVACGEGNETPQPGSGDSGATETLQLNASDDGTLEFCDGSGNCTRLPNPKRCDVLNVTIDTVTGRSCEVCTNADGSRSEEDCVAPSVACDIVTVPDPDCVVCAYVNGTVIFSTCQPSPPICYANLDGSLEVSGDALDPSANPPVDENGEPIAPPRGCTICIDQQGRRISQDCPPTCNDVLCPSIDECPAGSRLVTDPGACCSRCEPVNDCSGVACPLMLPYCPEGQWLVKDPADCCGWYCEPRECPRDVACLDVLIACAEGYQPSFDAPSCCGVCVPSTY